MRKLIFLSVFASLLLTGCGNKDYPALSAHTTPYQFTAGEGSVLTVELPDSLFPIKLSDNYYYTEFQNDVIATLFTGETTAGYDYLANEDLYVKDTSIIKPLESGHLVFTFPKEYYDGMLNILSTGTMSNVTVSTYDEWMLDAMPEVNGEEDMELLSGNMYMPPDSDVNALGGHVAVKWDGMDFIESFTQDGTLEKLSPLWLQRLQLNTNGATPSWSMANGVFYAECGRYCLTAKELTGNQYYVYVGTMPYRNHMLYGCSKLKYKEN